ncbi:MAG: hypothetical protein IIB81_00470 [Nanoarchaeota archaeon]|nr:hypothetical protein [Nanoarchaeota archaeon]
MVNFSTIAIIGGLGLLIFFRKDLGQALESFKGFGSEFGRDFGKIPDITINVPDFGLPKAFAETGEAVGQAGADLSKLVEQAGIDINQFGIDVQKNIADSIKGAQDVIDQSLKETQEGFEQFGKDVETNVGIISTGITDIGTGITEFVGGFFPDPKTTVSETVPSIVTTSRRTGTATRFGGQTAPKEILTPTTATGTGTTTDPFKAQQPDLNLVSPFLTQFQKDPITEPTLTTSRRTGTTGGR